MLKEINSLGYKHKFRYFVKENIIEYPEVEKL